MLKEYLSRLLLLSKLVEGKPLYLYLVVTGYAILGALVREEEKVQWPVYPEMEKLALALMLASRKLRPYFHSHLIWVLTNHPLRQVLQKPDASGCLLKWAIELSQFKIEFQPRPVIKGQALADFIAEFSHEPDERLEETPGPLMPEIPK